MEKRKLYYEHPWLYREDVYLENIFMAGSYENYGQRDDCLNKTVGKTASQRYEPPLMCVQEVVMEAGFLGGSHEGYKPVPGGGGHETMGESGTKVDGGDIDFTW